MREIIVLLAALVCAGHARRLQISAEQLESRPLAESAQELDTKGRPAPPHALAKLLAALDPSAAISHASSLQAMPRRVTRPAAPAVPQLLQLRGGIVQKISNAYLGIPTLTRSWLTLTILCSILHQLGMAEPELLALDSQAIVSKQELWRPMTALCFVGGVGGQLIQKGFNLVQMGRGLENYLGFGEYTRVIASCAALLAMLSNIVGWPFLGDGLIMAVTVLLCMLNPTQQTSMYGLVIPFIWMPFAQMVLSYLFTQQIPWMDIMGAVVGYIHYYINDNLKPDAVIWRRKAERDKRLGAGGGSGKKGSSKKKRPRRKIATLSSCDSGG